MNRSKEEEKAIGRITNIAQEKNANWLGYTNIAAMETLLKYIEKLEKNDKTEKIKNKIEELKRKREHCIKLDKIGIANHILKDIQMLEEILEEGENGRFNNRNNY